MAPKRIAAEPRRAELTDSSVRKLPLPAQGYEITWDDKIAGFGVRVTEAGAKSFVLDYRNRGGRQRRWTIGSFPTMAASRARAIAKEAKDRIRVNGADPVGDAQADRGAPTVAEVCKRFEDEHLGKKRESTASNYRAIIANDVRPELGGRKVAEITFSDVDALHRKVTKRGSPIQANRVVAVLSKIFTLAVRWGYRPDNPAKGIERNQETKRKRYLDAAEVKRLTTALAKLKDVPAANIVRLLMVTGARRGEVRAMQWAQLDLKQGIWTKPASTTKQNAEHRVPLSAPARQLLADIKAAAEAQAKKKHVEVSPYVFPGRSGGHRVELKDAWADLCKAAKITGARMHDLRHTYASVLASSGSSLPLIGALLGHSQAQTTQRYSHLYDDPLRKATETAAAILAGGPIAEVVSIDQGRRRRTRPASGQR